MAWRRGEEGWYVAWGGICTTAAQFLLRRVQTASCGMRAGYPPTRMPLLAKAAPINMYRTTIMLPPPAKPFWLLAHNRGALGLLSYNFTKAFDVSKYFFLNLYFMGYIYRVTEYIPAFRDSNYAHGVGCITRMQLLGPLGGEGTLVWRETDTHPHTGGIPGTEIGRWRRKPGECGSGMRQGRVGRRKSSSAEVKGVEVGAGVEEGKGGGG